jgi:aryl-alcohol dehydrogenase-like predicted oxidoreductase
MHGQTPCPAKPIKLMGMQFRKLGRTGFEVGDIGYGAWGIGGKQWLGGSDDESLLALHRAMELGVNLIDTALAYGDGHSEQLVGDAVRAAGRRIYVATKVPPKNRVWPAKSGTPIADVFPYDYLVSSAEESLRNLKLETIDLLQLHVWTDEWVERAAPSKTSSEAAKCNASASPPPSTIPIPHSPSCAPDSSTPSR